MTERVVNTSSERGASPRKLSVVELTRLLKVPYFGHHTALTFLKKHSTVPVPKVYRELELDGAHCIIMEYIKGDLLADVEEGSKPAVIEKLQDHIKVMHSISASQIGGISPPGLVYLPYRISRVDQVNENELRPFESDELVFCHNDLLQHNVLVDPETHVIQAIIDFEYSGFYPSFFEGQFYRRVGPSITLNGEDDDTDRLIDFINSHKVGKLKMLCCIG